MAGGSPGSGDVAEIDLISQALCKLEIKHWVKPKLSIKS
jgi:hypothetical protein